MYFKLGIHDWRFRIDKCQDNKICISAIGIWKIKTKITDTHPLYCFFASDEDWVSTCYGFAYNIAVLTDVFDGYIAWGSRKKSYGQKVKSGEC